MQRLFLTSNSFYSRVWKKCGRTRMTYTHTHGFFGGPVYTHLTHRVIRTVVHNLSLLDSFGEFLDSLVEFGVFVALFADFFTGMDNGRMVAAAENFTDARQGTVG